MKLYQIFFLLSVLLFFVKPGIAQKEHPKVRGIYNELIQVIGPSKPQPKLKVIRDYKKGDKLVFYKRYPHPEIYINQELIDFCTSFGKDQYDMLAGLLAHELGHHHLNHQASSFTSVFETATNAEVDFDSGHLEKDADAFGLVYSYLAGYNTLKQYPQLLELIYDQYFPDQENGLKNDRIIALKKHINTLESLIAVYETGFALTVATKYDAAIRSFRYVASQFPAKEIYNNIAVCYINKALESLNKDREIFFVYPVEVDASFRIRYKSRDFQNDKNNEESIINWLDSAATCLKQAILLDDAYASGYINLAVANILLKNYEGALGIFNEYKRKYPNDIDGNFYLIKAIALVQMGNESQAEKQFDVAKSKGAFYADYNYTVFKKLQENNYTDDAFPESLTNWVMSYFNESGNMNISSSFLQFVVSHPCSNVKLPVQETLNIGTSEHPFVIKYAFDEACSRIQVFLKETKYRLDKVSYNIPKVYNDYEVRPEYSITSDNGRVYDYIREHELIVESKAGFVYSVTSLR